MMISRPDGLLAQPRPSMMPAVTVALVLGLALGAVPAPASAAPTGPAADTVRRLLDKADMAYRGTTSAGVFDMKVKTSSFTRDYKVVMWDDSRGTDRTLVKILGPALWRGYGTLKVGDSLRLFNPTTNHVTVVGQSMLGDRWMGSHFTNDDLVKDTHLARDYHVALGKTWSGTLAGKAGTFYQIKLTPRPTAPVAWGRIDYQLFEAGPMVVPVRADYYRKAGDRNAVRTMSFSDVHDLGGRTLPSSLTVTVASKPGEFTRIHYTALKFNVAIPSSKFTEQALRK